MRALRCLWRGTNSLRRLRDDENFMRRYVCCITHRWRERCAGPIQSRPDRAYRHGGEPPQDPVRRLLRWISRVCVLAAPSPTMALVSPVPVICRNGSKDAICTQLICGAYDRFGSIATVDGKAKRPLTSASPQNRSNSGSSRHVRLVVRACDAGCYFRALLKYRKSGGG